MVYVVVSEKGTTLVASEPSAMRQVVCRYGQGGSTSPAGGCVQTLAIKETINLFAYFKHQVVKTQGAEGRFFTLYFSSKSGLDVPVSG
jgi:hypothetical protein